MLNIVRPALVALALVAGRPLPAETPGAVAARMDAAVERVKAIVNQPVPSFPAGPGDHPALFQPGWFHPGALTPDFDHVDVRASQDCAPYARWEYVTSDLNPGLMFRGADVEFNAMTKLFYTDRSLPKKKLTEAEMAEINDLYRTIGTCLAEWRKLQAGTGAPPATASAAPAGLPPELALAAAAPPAPFPAAPAGPDGTEPKRTGLLTPRNGLAAALVLALVLVLLQVRRRRA